MLTINFFIKEADGGNIDLELKSLSGYTAKIVLCHVVIFFRQIKIFINTCKL